MATGNYGIVRPSDVNVEDIQMYYNYTPNRQVPSTNMFELDATSLLNEITEPLQVEGIQQSYEGIKNLTLPAETFGNVGIYNIMIKPRKPKLK